MKEQWKDIKGYEGLYRISNYGNVLGLKRNRLLKHGINYKGDNKYMTVGLRLTPLLKTFQVNRLVYETFVGEIKGMIDHLDNDSTNCRIDNLIDVHKTFKYKNKFCRRVLDTETMQMYDSVSDLAKELGTSQNNLSARLNNKSIKYLKYKLLD